MHEITGNSITRLPIQTKRMSAIITITFFFAIVATVLISSWVITYLFTKNLDPVTFTPASAPPMAVIKNGNALIVPAGSTPLTLSAEGSFDPDGGPLTYEWTITSGPQNTPIILPFIASRNHLYTVDRTVLSAPGTWTIALTITDDENKSTSTSTHIIVESSPIPVSSPEQPYPEDK